MTEIRAKLIEAGVRNEQEFGYPACNKDNILTDMVYRTFFISMLKENKGHGRDIDAAIDGLLAECEAEKAKGESTKPKGRKAKKS